MTDVLFAAIARQLDRLPGDFAAAMLRGASRDIDDTIERMLEQLGEALGTDHLVFESVPEERSLWPGRVWRTGGSAADGDALTIPILVAGRRMGALSVGFGDDGAPWPAAIQDRVRALANLIAVAARLVAHRAESESQRECAYAATSLGAVDEGIGAADFEEIIGDSPGLRAAIGRVQEVAPTDASVVIRGETGTGKGLFARAVHHRSRRRARPFVRVNCAALPPTLIESELFGHERGAFTGAVSMRQGRFELAHTGTLYLDEIGDLLPDVQAKLLRVLQEGEFERVGSSHSRRVDVRVVAATHHDLEAAVKNGRFRADLYYRLNVFPIVLPPLRERAQDIPRQIWFFVNRRQRALDRKFTTIPPAVVAALQQHQWPGNVGELENVVERAMIHSTGNTFLLDDGPGLFWSSGNCETGTLEVVERRHIEEALRRCRWRINGAGNAAEVLGLHPNTLRFRMKKLGIQRPAASGVVRDFQAPAGVTAAGCRL
jgi:transcriptional regulator with GAF, ATPase, and Fis domain